MRTSTRRGNDIGIKRLVEQEDFQGAESLIKKNAAVPKFETSGRRQQVLRCQQEIRRVR